VISRFIDGRVAQLIFGRLYHCCSKAHRLKQVSGNACAAIISWKVMVNGYAFAPVKRSNTGERTLTARVRLEVAQRF
jgi:hypothetical protein